ncbi:MAG: HNH endonuclease [Proteobacteria bacterium]|nr:MAG: HNH endonuclease [Pseudomonadota bacterium]
MTFVSSRGVSTTSVSRGQIGADMERKTMISSEQLFLKKLDDDQLVFDTREAIRSEREATSLVVKYFREIEARRLYLKQGYGSLFEFATSVLGYCAGSAQNRINAMKLVIALPEVESKIESGELSLTAASKVQSFFKAESKAKKSYTGKEQLKVVELCCSKSTREVERELAGLNPDVAKHESTKPVGLDRYELNLTISEELEQDIRKLKSLLAHSQSEMTTEHLLERLVELGLERFDPVRKAERSQKRKATKHNASLSDSSNSELVQNDVSADDLPDVNKLKADSFHAHETAARYIPAEARHAVWLRNAGKGCEYEQSGKRCGSQHALQIDHVIGFARGGTHDVENLRILCAKHNRYVWQQNIPNSVVRSQVALYEAA